MVGSKGMMGAAILAAKACLLLGAGKLTCYIPEEGVSIVQAGIPEAMCSIDTYTGDNEKLDKLACYDSIGIGPGIGNTEESKKQIIVFLKAI